jgi:proline iminopeptidase
MPAARVWAGYEGACSTLHHDVKDAVRNSGGGSGKGAFTLARIEAHYFINNMFLDDGVLIKNIGRLEGVPSVIVQGRYDMVCPIKGADALVRAWPGGTGNGMLEYHVIADAGHAASEPGIRAALMAATEKFKSLGV